MTHNPSTSQKIRAILSSGQRARLLGLFTMILVGMALEMIGVALVFPALILMIEPERVSGFSARLASYGVRADSRESMIALGVSALVVMYVVKNLFLGLLAWRETLFIHRLRVELSADLFETYLKQPYVFHLNRNSAHLINRVVHQVNLFASYGVGASLRLAAEAAVVIGLVTLLVIIEPLGALGVAVIGLFMGWSFLKTTQTKIHHWALSRQYHDDMLLQKLKQGLGAAKEIILLGRQSEILNQYSVHNVRSAHATQRHEFLQQLPRLGLEVMCVGSLAVLTWVMLSRGYEPRDVIPTAGIFAAAAIRLLPSGNRIISSVQSIRYAVPAVDRLYRDLHRARCPFATASSDLDYSLKTSIVLDRVSYCYPDSSQVIVQNVSVAINKGECVGIVGESGAGKSTILDILLGLLVPTSGAVLVDGKDVRNNVRGWQRQLGYVPQAIYLNDESIRGNVAFGVAEEEIDDDAGWRALRAARLEDFVSSLEHGLDTVVGEMGVRISGGERQRVGIARALYHDPAILVLDEATSSLDFSTESELMRTIREMRRTKTIVVVTHRLSSIIDFDRVYVVVDGRISEVKEKEFP